MGDQGMIEVELRGILTWDEYNALYNYLVVNSDNFAKDDKVSYFFVTENRILKVVNNNNNNTALWVLKIGDETKNILEEIELNIDPAFVEKMVELLRNLGYSKINKVTQDRTNFYYKGAVIALKYTQDRGFHFELEMMAINEKEAMQKKSVLIELCTELNIKYMSPEEIRDKIYLINKNHGLL